MGLFDTIGSALSTVGSAAVSGAGTLLSSSGLNFSNLTNVAFQLYQQRLAQKAAEDAAKRAAQIQAAQTSFLPTGISLPGVTFPVATAFKPSLAAAATGAAGPLDNIIWLLGILFLL